MSVLTSHSSRTAQGRSQHRATGNPPPPVVGNSVGHEQPSHGAADAAAPDVPAVGRLGPQAGLSLVVRVDVDARRADVFVGGGLTAANCDRLLSVCARAGRLAPRLAVTVDLGGSAYISAEALDRLGRYPCWTVAGHGQPVMAELRA